MILYFVVTSSPLYIMGTNDDKKRILKLSTRCYGRLIQQTRDYPCIMRITSMKPSKLKVDASKTDCLTICIKPITNQFPITVPNLTAIMSTYPPDSVIDQGVISLPTSSTTKLPNYAHLAFSIL